MAEEKKNPLIGAFRSAPAKDQEPPDSKVAEPEKAAVPSGEKAKPAEKPVEKKTEKAASTAAEKPGKAEAKPVTAPAEKRDEKKPEEKPSAAPAKPEDKKAAASAKAEEKKPAEDKGAEGMPESKKVTEKKDQTDADGIPEDFRLNIVGEGALGSVVMLPVEKIDDFEGHPFPVQDDKDMLDLVESIKKFGVLEPVTVIRSGKDPERYEMVAGHRRKHGCTLAGVAQIPAIVRDMDRDSAIIYMVDSNLKRENISPMVKARAYTMKLEAMKRKAGRPTKAQMEAGYKPMRADEQLAQQTGESRATIQRLTRLTKLEPELQNMVEEKKLPVNTAADISYLKPQEQKALADGTGGPTDHRGKHQAAGRRQQKLSGISLCPGQGQQAGVRQDQHGTPAAGGQGAAGVSAAGERPVGVPRLRQKRRSLRGGQGQERPGRAGGSYHQCGLCGAGESVFGAPRLSS